MSLFFLEFPLVQEKYIVYKICNGILLLCYFPTFIFKFKMVSGSVGQVIKNAKIKPETISRLFRPQICVCTFSEVNYFKMSDIGTTSFKMKSTCLYRGIFLEGIHNVFYFMNIGLILYERLYAKVGKNTDKQYCGF
jgi:hypothetical protein